MTQEHPPVNHVRIYSLTAYPRTVELMDKIEVTLRPMIPGDEKELVSFFLKVPEKDRRYLKEDVTSPEVATRWARELDYNRVLPIIAVHDGHIVADATLHHRRSIARAHVGEVRLVVHPDFRGRGLGTILLRALIEIAVDGDLERLVFELASDEEDAAIEAAERLGFVGVATLQGHVKDPTGKPLDIVILEHPLGRFAWWYF